MKSSSLKKRKMRDISALATIINASATLLLFSQLTVGNPLHLSALRLRPLVGLKNDNSIVRINRTNASTFLNERAAPVEPYKQSVNQNSELSPNSNRFPKRKASGSTKISSIKASSLEDVLPVSMARKLIISMQKVASQTNARSISSSSNDHQIVTSKPTHGPTKSPTIPSTPTGLPIVSKKHYQRDTPTASSIPSHKPTQLPVILSQRIETITALPTISNVTESQASSIQSDSPKVSSIPEYGSTNSPTVTPEPSKPPTVRKKPSEIKITSAQVNTTTFQNDLPSTSSHKQTQLTGTITSQIDKTTAFPTVSLKPSKVSQTQVSMILQTNSPTISSKPSYVPVISHRISPEQSKPTVSTTVSNEPSTLKTPSVPMYLSTKSPSIASELSRPTALPTASQKLNNTRQTLVPMSTVIFETDMPTSSSMPSHEPNHLLPIQTPTASPTVSKRPSDMKTTTLQLNNSIVQTVPPTSIGKPSQLPAMLAEPIERPTGLPTVSLKPSSVKLMYEPTKSPTKFPKTSKPTALPPISKRPSDKKTNSSSMISLKPSNAPAKAENLMQSDLPTVGSKPMHGSSKSPTISPKPSKATALPTVSNEPSNEQKPSAALDTITFHTVSAAANGINSHNQNELPVMVTTKRIDIPTALPTISSKPGNISEIKMSLMPTVSSKPMHGATKSPNKTPEPSNPAALPPISKRPSEMKTNASPMLSLRPSNAPAKAVNMMQSDSPTVSSKPTQGSSKSPTTSPKPSKATALPTVSNEPSNLNMTSSALDTITFHTVSAAASGINSHNQNELPVMSTTKRIDTPTALPTISSKPGYILEIKMSLMPTVSSKPMHGATKSPHKTLEPSKPTALPPFSKRPSEMKTNASPMLSLKPSNAPAKAVNMMQSDSPSVSSKPSHGSSKSPTISPKPSKATALPTVSNEPSIQQKPNASLDTITFQTDLSTTSSINSHHQKELPVMSTKRIYAPTALPTISSKPGYISEVQSPVSQTKLGMMQTDLPTVNIKLMYGPTTLPTSYSEASRLSALPTVSKKLSDTKATTVPVNTSSVSQTQSPTISSRPSKSMIVSITTDLAVKGQVSEHIEISITPTFQPSSHMVASINPTTRRSPSVSLSFSPTSLQTESRRPHKSPTQSPTVYGMNHMWDDDWLANFVLNNSAVQSSTLPTLQQTTTLMPSLAPSGRPSVFVNPSSWPTSSPSESSRPSNGPSSILVRTPTLLPTVSLTPTNISDTKDAPVVTTKPMYLTAKSPSIPSELSRPTALPTANKKPNNTKQTLVPINTMIFEADMSTSSSKTSHKPNHLLPIQTPTALPTVSKRPSDMKTTTLQLNNSIVQTVPPKSNSKPSQLPALLAEPIERPTGLPTVSLKPSSVKLMYEPTKSPNKTPEPSNPAALPPISKRPSDMKINASPMISLKPSNAPAKAVNLMQSDSPTVGSKPMHGSSKSPTISPKPSKATALPTVSNEPSNEQKPSAALDTITFHTVSAAANGINSHNQNELPVMSTKRIDTPTALPTISSKPGYISEIKMSLMPTVSSKPMHGSTKSPNKTPEPSNPAAFPPISKRPSEMKTNASPMLSLKPSNAPAKAVNMMQSDSPSVSSKPSHGSSKSPTISPKPSKATALPTASNEPSDMKATSMPVISSSSPTYSPSIQPNTPSVGPKQSATVSFRTSDTPTASPTISFLPSDRPEFKPLKRNESSALLAEPFERPTGLPTISLKPSSGKLMHEPTKSPSYSPSIQLNTPSVGPKQSATVSFRTSDTPTVSPTISFPPSDRPEFKPLERNESSSGPYIPPSNSFEPTPLPIMTSSPSEITTASVGMSYVPTVYSPPNVSIKPSSYLLTATTLPSVTLSPPHTPSSESTTNKYLQPSNQPSMSWSNNTLPLSITPFSVQFTFTNASIKKSDVIFLEKSTVDFLGRLFKTNLTKQQVDAEGVQITKVEDIASYQPGGQTLVRIKINGEVLFKNSTSMNPPAQQVIDQLIQDSIEARSQLGLLSFLYEARASKSLDLLTSIEYVSEDQGSHDGYHINNATSDTDGTSTAKSPVSVLPVYVWITLAVAVLVAAMAVYFVAVKKSIRSVRSYELRSPKARAVSLGTGDEVFLNVSRSINEAGEVDQCCEVELISTRSTFNTEMTKMDNKRIFQGHHPSDNNNIIRPVQYCDCSPHELEKKKIKRRRTASKKSERRRLARDKHTSYVPEVVLPYRDGQAISWQNEIRSSDLTSQNSGVGGCQVFSIFPEDSKDHGAYFSDDNLCFEQLSTNSKTSMSTAANPSSGMGSRQAISVFPNDSPFSDDERSSFEGMLPNCTTSMPAATHPSGNRGGCHAISIFSEDSKDQLQNDSRSRTSFEEVSPSCF